MKNKTLVIFAIVLIIGFFGVVQNADVIFAQTQDAKEQKTVPAAQSPNQDLLAIIEQLKNQIKELQNQLAKLKSEIAEVKEELKLTKNLRKGLSDEEVVELQKFLSQFREIYPEGLITGYFGSLTEKAVKKFQEKYGIESVGVVGPLTRDKINEFLTEEAKEEKITICHVPLGNTDLKHNLTIGKSALEAHLAHSDAIGACPQEPAPTVPTPTTPSPTPTTPTSTPTSLPAVPAGCDSVTSVAAATPTPVPATSALGCSGLTSIIDSRDINNPVYETVEIGNQCWLKRNLNVGTYVTDIASQTNNNIIERYCYGNITTYCDTYGGLYQYDEAINYYSSVPAETDVIQGICPSGWHVPRDSEWNILATYLGGASMAGEKMKEIGYAHWYNHNITDDNSSGFTAYGAGRRSIVDRFYYNRAVAFFWSSLPCGATNALYRHINSDEIALYRVAHDRSDAISVRCIKD